MVVIPIYFRHVSQVGDGWVMVFEHCAWEWFDFRECDRLPVELFPCDGCRFDAREHADVFHCGVFSGFCGRRLTMGSMAWRRGSRWVSAIGTRSSADVAHALAGLPAFRVAWARKRRVDGVRATFRPGVGPAADLTHMHVEMMDIRCIVRCHRASRLWFICSHCLTPCSRRRHPHELVMWFLR